MKSSLILTALASFLAALLDPGCAYPLFENQNADGHRLGERDPHHNLHHQYRHHYRHHHPVRDEYYDDDFPRARLPEPKRDAKLNHLWVDVNDALSTAKTADKTGGNLEHLKKFGFHPIVYSDDLDSFFKINKDSEVIVVDNPDEPEDGPDHKGKSYVVFSTNPSAMDDDSYVDDKGEEEDVADALEQGLPVQEFGVKENQHVRVSITAADKLKDHLEAEEMVAKPAGDLSSHGSYDR